MNDITNFYDDLDLKYPEIAIAMEDIDRTKPGKVKFCIPVLTPNMDNEKMSENTEHQNASNLVNADKRGLDITNIQISNYIEIYVPPEFCALDGGEYEITSGTVNIVGGGIDINGYASISGSISGSGSVGVESIHVNGQVSGDETINGTQSVNGASISGTITITPSNKIIPAGSKWIVVFIGGDITKPRIIGRYNEEE